MTSGPRPDPISDRWRQEVRAALPGADADLVDEIAHFVAARWEDARARGVAAEAADRQARLDIDAWRARPEPARPLTRRAAAAWLGWGADLRLAGRSLRLHPIFTVGAILLSTISAAAIICSVALVYGILFRPLPYPAAERLAVIWTSGDVGQLSYPDFVDLSSASVFDGAAAMAGGRGSLRIGDGFARVNSLALEPAGYALLGARPAAGRLLTASDAGLPNVMVSDRLWRTHLQSDPAVVGRQIWLSGREMTIVGVLRPGFDFELPIPPYFEIEENDIWLAMDVAAPPVARRDFRSYEGLVRLAPGRTLREAQSALDGVAARLAQQHPSTNDGRHFRIVSLLDDVTASARQPLALVALAAVIALVVALANLVILGLVRGLERQAELSVRDALGAGGFRLRRQLFTEHAVIAVSGVTVGTLAAYYVTQLLVASEAANLPRADAIRFDAPVLCSAALVALLVTLTLSAPPLRLRTSDLRMSAREVGSARRSRRFMVATEIALALSLATGGALLGVSLTRLMAVDTGFDPTGSAAARVSTYAARYPQREDVLRLHDQVLSRVREVPDVTAAGAGSSLPLSGQTTGTSIVAEGRVDGRPRPTAGWQYVTPGYLDAVGMRLRAGRDFTAHDTTRQGHVTIINEALAKMLFPGEDPIGQRVAIGGGDQENDWHEVVGVVEDVRHTALDVAPSPRIYDLFGQHWGRTMFVVARSGRGDANSALATLRSAMAAADPEAPLFEAATLQSLVERSASTHRLSFTVALGLALAGVLLALIGAYAVASASVAERAREIGLRAALGATPGDLLRVVGGEIATTAAAGAACGSVASIGIARLMSTELFGVQPAEAVWIVPAVATLVLLALAMAVVPPARRAAAIDPAEALRTDR